MKRILIIIPAFNHGGTNKSLLNLLSCMNKDKYHIDIFAISHLGPYLEILSSFNILKRNLLLSSVFDNYKCINRNSFIEKIAKIIIKSIYRILCVIYGKKVLIYIYKKVASMIDKMNYQTVIAMQEGTATHIASYVHTPAIALVRCDYSKYYDLIKKDEIEIYSKYKHIICVSEYTKNIFLEYYPSLKNRCYGIHNMIDYKSIIELSNESMELDTKFDTTHFCIISIGRLSKVKQFDIIPEIAYRIKSEGIKFKWYIIGEGEERNNILNTIEKFNISNIVILLGEKNNPYPYIKKSDLLVCTSASEACPNVINEARILHIPVVTTDFGSSQEFIENNINGIIESKENIEKSIIDLIQNKSKYDKIKSNIISFMYSNETIIEKIESLL